MNPDPVRCDSGYFNRAKCLGGSSIAARLLSVLLRFSWLAGDRHIGGRLVQGLVHRNSTDELIVCTMFGPS